MHVKVETIYIYESHLYPSKSLVGRRFVVVRMAEAELGSYARR